MKIAGYGNHFFPALSNYRRAAEVTFPKTYFMELAGKKAIVTGASKGIGLATVKALLEAGVHVAGWSRSKPELEHDNFHFFSCDVSKHEEVEAALGKTRAAMGDDISILVNNAGLGFQAAIDEITLEEWHQMFDVNVHGLFYCTRLVVPLMRPLGESHIINISSIAGTNAIETMSGYCATKHAVNAISHSLFKELRNDGIKVTNVMPGSVQTNFFDKIDSVTAHDNMMSADDIAGSIMYVLGTSANYLPADLEVRPLKPKG